MAANPIRNCVLCGQTDDHPRHCVQLSDGNWADYHHDCHANFGCELCKELVQDLEEGKVGEDMRVHLMAVAEDWRLDQEAQNAPKDEVTA